MAIGVLEVFAENTRNEFNYIILLREIPFLNTNSLELAARFKCKLFIAHPTAQSILTDIWNDNLKKAVEKSVCFLNVCHNHVNIINFRVIVAYLTN